MENKTTPLKYYTDEVNNQIEKTLQAKKRVWSFKDSVKIYMNNIIARQMQ